MSWARTARRIRVPLGFVLAALFLWLAHPTLKWMLASLALVVPGIALRAVAAGHVKKNRELTTTGPYAYTRNPLYLGSMLIGIGFGIAARSFGLAIALAIMFLAIYLPVISSEEAYLRGEFAGFDDYVRRVPRLLPRVTPATKERGSFSGALYRKHREYNAIIGTVVLYSALVLKWYFLATR